MIANLQKACLNQRSHNIFHIPSLLLISSFTLSVWFLYSSKNWKGGRGGRGRSCALGWLVDL